MSDSGAAGPRSEPAQQSATAHGRAIPTIGTARLRLRAFRADDLPEQARILGDVEVMRHVGGVGLTREESWRRMIGATGLWAMLGYGYWAVERREDGRLVGQVGFADFKREMTPSIDGLPEMGWIFAPGAQGKGYASEAVAAGLAWADENLGAQEIVAIIDRANAASIRVADKAGFALCEPAVYRSEEILLFRRRRR